MIYTQKDPPATACPFCGGRQEGQCADQATGEADQEAHVRSFDDSNERDDPAYWAGPCRQQTGGKIALRMASSERRAGAVRAKRANLPTHYSDITRCVQRSWKSFRHTPNGRKGAMRSKKWRAKAYVPRPNPVASALCTLGVRTRVQRSAKAYRRTVKHRRNPGLEGRESKRRQRIVC